MLVSEPPKANQVLSAEHPKMKFSFYICGLQMCSQLIMDESKSLFHLMLQHFLAKDGVTALENILYEGILHFEKNNNW